MTENNENPQNEPGAELTPPGEGLSTPILVDPKMTKQDINLARRAIRERWPMTPEARAALTNRLLRIVDKEEVAVPTRDGGIEYVDSVADVNAISAARVLVAMEGQSQADQHLIIKADDDANKVQGGDTFNIGCVGQIALGQDPVSPEDARRQAQEVLARVRARTGGLKSPPGGENVAIDVTPVVPKPIGLDDL